MNTDEIERSYLDMLRAELRQYEKNRQVAADKLVADGSPSQIRDVLYSIKKTRPDLRLHGFGLKRTALSWLWIRDTLHSADSMAWSFAARKARLSGDLSRSANDWREADQFNRKITGDDLSDLPLFKESI